MSFQFLSSDGIRLMIDVNLMSMSHNYLALKRDGILMYSYMSRMKQLSRQKAAAAEAGDDE